MVRAIAAICILLALVVSVTLIRQPEGKFLHNEDSELAQGQMKFAFDHDDRSKARVDEAENRETAQGDILGQCVGVLRITDFSGVKLLMLYDQDNNDCDIGETPENRKIVLDACQIGRWCAVMGDVTAAEGDPKHLHVGVNKVFLALDLRNRLPRKERQVQQPPPKPAVTSQPNLKVSWYAQPTRSVSGHKPALDYEYFVKIQSADDAPVTLKEISVNERNNCIVLAGGTPKMVFGDVFTAALNPFIQGCTDVLRVRVVTDRGEMTYNFK
jgi:hypothetical protein